MNITATKTKTYTVSLTREFNVPRERVFEAWTNPEMLTQWFGPREVTTQAAQVDLRVGGKYRLTLQEPNGNVIDHGGEYREIDPPRRLVFTWVLEGQNCEGSEGQFAETVVTLEFQESGASTRLILTHEFLPSEESKEGHTMGWIGSFDCLAAVLV